MRGVDASIDAVGSEADGRTLEAAHRQRQLKPQVIVSHQLALDDAVRG